MWVDLDSKGHPRDREGYLDILLEDYQDVEALRDLTELILRDGWSPGTYPWPENLPALRQTLSKVQDKMDVILAPLTPDLEDRQSLIYQAIASYLGHEFLISDRIAFGFLSP